MIYTSFKRLQVYLEHFAKVVLAVQKKFQCEKICEIVRHHCSLFLFTHLTIILVPEDYKCSNKHPRLHFFFLSSEANSNNNNNNNNNSGKQEEVTLVDDLYHNN